MHRVPSLVLWLLAAMLPAACSIGAGDSSATSVESQSTTTNSPDGSAAVPERFDIAYIEYYPLPHHLRYMSDSGHLSAPVYVPDDMEVWAFGQNDLCWSPDGDLIVFAATTGSGSDRDIYTMRPGGGDLTQKTTAPAADYSPDWSPDGTRIAFLTDRNDAYHNDVYVHDLATGVETRITPTSGFYTSPVWSPDGTRIAYAKNISYVDGDEIFIHDLAADTSTQIGSLPGPLLVQGLHWSPSEDTLLFYNGLGGDVFRIGIDGNGLTNLTTDLTTESSADPSWYSDNQVLFRSFIEGQVGFYRMTLTGGQKTLVGHPGGAASNPVYRFAATDLPDLVVSSYSVHDETADPTDPVFHVLFRIRNIGLAPSPPTLVYVDAVNPAGASSTENEIRIQVRVDLDGLESGVVSAPLMASFDGDEMYAQGVTLVRITVDPKHDVVEAFENNNVAEVG